MSAERPWKRVERWRPVVEQELARLKAPLPPEHVLSVMQRESGGNPGAVNTSSGASGLLQVMPIALKDYNQNHRVKYTMAQLRGHSSQSTAIQVRVGLWVLMTFVKGAYRYLKKRLGQVALDDLIRVADTFYATGPARARARLNKLSSPTWEAIRARFPTWDRVRPAELVWNRANAWGGVWSLPAIDKWLESELVLDNKKTAGGAIVGLLLCLAAWYYFKKRGNK